MDSQLNKISLISLNVNGINNPIKRYKMLMYLNSINCDIAMLQETHLNATESNKLRQKWVGQVFPSPGFKDSRGVSILIKKKKKLPFKFFSVHYDNDGRYVITSGCLRNVKLTLVNLYAPNTQQALFFASLCPVISQFMEGPLIIGGDFNSVCDPTLDRSSSPFPQINRYQQPLRSFKLSLL